METEKTLFSNCCGWEDSLDPISNRKYSEIEICPNPKCQQHCEFIELKEKEENGTEQQTN